MRAPHLSKFFFFIKPPDSFCFFLKEVTLLSNVASRSLTSFSPSCPSPPAAILLHDLHPNTVTPVRATAATATTPAAPASATGDYARELEVATDAVRMASTLCQEVQAQLMRQDEQAVTKDDKSLVTLADYAAQVGRVTTPPRSWEES